jgi:hypothetical protein
MVAASRIVVFVAALAAVAAQPAPTPRPAVPVDAITAIVDAFTTHDVVALGEGPHGNQQGHDFRLALLRDPRFAATVNDILVEFGNGRYQTLMDRFVDGADVARDELRHVWQDTTTTNAGWERPIYEEFFRAVRSLNASLPRERHLRVLLGDAPIDWERVTTQAELRNWSLGKDVYAGDLVRREVLLKHRRVLVIYGDGHLQGRGFPEKSLINIIERSPERPKVFAIGSSFAALARAEPGVNAWPAPSLASVRGTTVGARPYGLFYPVPPAPGWSAVHLEDQFDAMLYLGPQAAMTPPLPRELCADPAYMKMRLGRIALDDERVAKSNAEILKAYCAGQTGQ